MVTVNEYKIHPAMIADEIGRVDCVRIAEQLSLAGAVFRADQCADLIGRQIVIVVARAGALILDEGDGDHLSVGQQRKKQV